MKDVELASEPHVLIVDDDPQMGPHFAQELKAHGLKVSVCSDGETACAFLDQRHVDAVVLELELAPMSGWEILKRVRKDHPGIPTFVVGHSIDVPAAVHAVRAGATDVLQKPIRLAELEVRLREAIARRSQPPANEHAREALPRRSTPEQGGLERIIGHSPAITRVREQIRGIARFDQVATLIIGETGTGKEVVAEALHALGARDRPFVTINCAAIPDSLFESELFGHEAGSFTGARTSKPGLLETAGDGTVLLDEVGEMALAMQPKLLRVLQNRTFRRVGGSRDIELRARIISATNRKLSASRQDGMRSDLYFRLAGFTLVLPPLRHRTEDIELLANRFLLDFASQYPGMPTRLGPDATARLLAHSWPGNVRELKRAIEQAAVISNSAVLDADSIHRALGERFGGSSLPPPAEIHESGKFRTGDYFPPDPPASSQELPRSSTGQGLNELQQQMILDAYEAHAHNLSRAAKALRIPRTTLRDRLKRYGCL
ncbi:MAG TPA: sigma-54 dependent transcriptional regulator [Polyangiaceae bacterium]|nr:sigma-54 dependent transcriptional regulator [Polyangiaceae bacterium]